MREGERRVKKTVVVVIFVCLTWPNDGSAGQIIPVQLKLTELLVCH